MICSRVRCPLQYTVRLYVDLAKANNEFVIARSKQIRDLKEMYWIISKDFSIENIDCEKIDCDSIIQSNVTGPLNLIEFRNKLKEWKVDLTF